MQRHLANNQRQAYVRKFLDYFTGSDFNAYANWLHTGAIPVNTRASEQRRSARLADLYRLGRALEDDRFQDCVTDAYTADLQNGDLPGRTEIESVYGSTVAGDRVRTILAQAYAKRGDKCRMKALRGEMPAAFVTDVLLALCDVRDQSPSNISVANNRDSRNSLKNEDRSESARPKKRARVQELDAQTLNVAPWMIDEVSKRLPFLADKPTIKRAIEAAGRNIDVAVSALLDAEEYASASSQE